MIIQYNTNQIYSPVYDNMSWIHSFRCAWQAVCEIGAVM